MALAGSGGNLRPRDFNRVSLCQAANNKEKSELSEQHNVTSGCQVDGLGSWGRVFLRRYRSRAAAASRALTAGFCRHLALSA